MWKVTYTVHWPLAIVASIIQMTLQYNTITSLVTRTVVDYLVESEVQAGKTGYTFLIEMGIYFIT